ncbi:MAG TPA: hypothetical protein VGL00_00265 [Terracidiphilus sp.]
MAESVNPGKSKLALLKLVAGAALACIACWLIADSLVSLPGLPRIV